MPADQAHHLIRGRSAEERAWRWLRLRGWRLCARNWVGGGGELDIVASRWTTLLVVEVRARSSAERAWASIDRDKLKRTKQAALALINQHGLRRYRLRIDLIAVDTQGRISRKRDIVV